MAEGYLAVLINPQIPDSVWLEKGPQPLKDSPQDPFAVAFEERFPDCEAAYTFVLEALAASGFRPSGGQFKGLTTKDLIRVLWKASKERVVISDSKDPPSSAPVKPESAEQLDSALMIVGVGLGILFLAAWLLAMVGTDGSTSSAPVAAITTSNVRTYWIYGYPTAGGAACIPAIAFAAKNNTDGEVADAIFSATFTEVGSKVVYGTGITALLGSLPAGYTRETAIATTDKGVVTPFAGCRASDVPKLTVSVSVSASASGLRDLTLVSDKAVNNDASTYFGGQIQSVEEAPANLFPAFRF
jgi:hypothetical protein